MLGMDKASQVLIIPALLTLDVLVGITVSATSLSKTFSTTVSWGVLVAALFIADVVIGEFVVRYWDRPRLSYDLVLPSRIELTFNANGKPVKKNLNIISMKVTNEGKRPAHSPSVVMDAVNLAKGGPHVLFDFNREFGHPTFLPIQTITGDPSEREFAYLVFQASKEVATIEGGDQGNFMVGFTFVQESEGVRAKVYLPSDATGEPYPVLPYESWYVDLLAQHKNSRIRPISEDHFVLKGSKWNEPQLLQTSNSLDQALEEYRTSRYAEAASEPRNAGLRAKRGS